MARKYQFDQELHLSWQPRPVGKPKKVTDHDIAPAAQFQTHGREVASLQGRFVENAAIEILKKSTNGGAPYSPEIRCLAEEIQKEAGTTVKARRLKLVEANAPSEMGRTHRVVARGFSNASTAEKVVTFLEQLDQLNGTAFYSQYDALPFTGGEKSFDARYIIEAALSLTHFGHLVHTWKDIPFHPFIPPTHTLIPDVRIYSDAGRQITQIDALAINHQIMTKDPYDFRRDLAGSHALRFESWDVKYVSRLGYNTASAIKQPLLKHLIKGQQQMAEIALLHEKGPTSRFIPKRIHLCYLSAGAAQIHTITVDSHYLQGAVMGLQERISEPGQQSSKLQERYRLIDIFQQAYCERLKEENSERRIREKRLAKNKLTIADAELVQTGYNLEEHTE